MGRTTFAIVQNWHAALQKGLCEQALIFTIIEPKLLDENTMFEDGTASETTRGTTRRPSEENDKNVGRHGDRRSEGIRAEGRALALLTAEGGLLLLCCYPSNTCGLNTVELAGTENREAGWKERGIQKEGEWLKEDKNASQTRVVR